MDWRAVAFDWNRARAFLVTAEEGSLSAAARALGLTQPTLGRQVGALEEEFGVTLFERGGRGWRLTASGRDLLEHLRPMGEAARRVSFSASGHSQLVEGPIRITASEVNAAHLLPPVLARIRREHPGIVVTVVATNAVRDLRRREADIAIRSGQPTEPELVTTRLRDTPARLYATPGYLRSIGSPKTVLELSRASFIGFDDEGRFLTGLNAMGFDLTRANFPLHADSHLVLWALVKSGLGVGVITEDVGENEPLVQRVLPTLAPISVPTWLVAHREIHTSKRVRVVFDLIAEHLGPKRARTPPPSAPKKAPPRRAR